MPYSCSTEMHTSQLWCRHPPQPGSGTFSHIPSYTVRLLSQTPQKQGDCFPLNGSGSFPFTLPSPWYLSHTGPGSDSPSSRSHLTIGAVIVAFWDEHLLELLPGLLLGVLPLSHTPGHICGKTEQEGKTTDDTLRGKHKLLTMLPAGLAGTT